MLKNFIRACCSLFCIMDVNQLKLDTRRGSSQVREFRMNYFTDNKQLVKQFEDLYFTELLQAD